MSFGNILVYLASLLVTISVALLIRRVYARGPHGVRTWLATGVIVVLGVALLAAFIG
jgi:hypothetical protein